MDTGFQAWQQQFSDWNFHLSEIQGNDRLREEDKAAIIEGFTILKRILGDDWLHRCFEIKHPFLWWLANRAAIELIEPGVIHYVIGPWNKREEVLAWQERHGIQGIEGPPIEGNEIRRSFRGCFAGA